MTTIDAVHICVLQTEVELDINCDLEINTWNNDMANDMMTLDQECEAFGERMPKKTTNGNKEVVED